MSQSPETSVPPPDTNEVRLSGRVSSPPASRVLPSGDEIVTFRLVVRRSARARRRSRQTVDSIECTVWTAALRRRALRLGVDDRVEVQGELRARFSRGRHGLVGRVTVDLRTLTRAPVASSP